MKINVKKMLVMVSLIIIITSCKKNQNQPQEVDASLNSKPISLRNGMLVFRDSTVFRTYYSASIQGKIHSDNELLENFISYKSIYDKAQDDFSKVSSQQGLELFLKSNFKNIVFNITDKSISSKFTNPTLMRFVNAEGKFMIGNALQIVTSSDYISVVNPTPEKISLALSNQNSLVDKDVVKHSRLMSISGSSARSVEVPLPNGMLNEVTYYNEDGKRRLFVQVWNDYDPGYNQNHLFVSLFQQKKGTFGGWSNNQTDLYFNDLILTGLAYRGIPYNNQAGGFNNVSQPYAVTWPNTTGPVFYEIPLMVGGPTPFFTHYDTLRILDLKGHFFSGGVPNTPNYQLYLN